MHRPVAGSHAGSDAGHWDELVHSTHLRATGSQRDVVPEQSASARQPTHTRAVVRQYGVDGVELHAPTSSSQAAQIPLSHDPVAHGVTFSTQVRTQRLATHVSEVAQSPATTHVTQRCKVGSHFGAVDVVHCASATHSTHVCEPALSQWSEASRQSPSPEQPPAAPPVPVTAEPPAPPVPAPPPCPPVLVAPPVPVVIEPPPVPPVPVPASRARPKSRWPSQVAPSANADSNAAATTAILIRVPAGCWGSGTT